MSRILACAAVAALIAVPAASSAQDVAARDVIPGYQPSAFEQSIDSLEARMEEFGERAEAIAEDEGLSEDEREAGVAALWREYAPDLTAFTAAAAAFGAGTAGTVMANMDIGGMVEASLREADIEGQIANALADADIEGQIELAMADLNIDAAVEAAMAEAGAADLDTDIDVDIEVDADDAE